MKRIIVSLIAAGLVVPMFAQSSRSKTEAPAAPAAGEVKREGDSKKETKKKASQKKGHKSQ